MKPVICATILLFILAGCTQSNQNKMRFTLLEPSETGVYFVNRVEDSESLNIIKYLYFYNGGGVATGDLNNDGLPDLFFTSNLEQSRLYLNLGNFKFRDITEASGINDSGNWKAGVTLADVNADGWLDIYVCEVGGYRNLKGRNRLYINNQNLTFTEQAEAYNLNFSGFGTHAAFFDFDRDGDLDVYLLNHSVHANYTLADRNLRLIPDERSGDKLMRNDNGKFTDVTREAGIYTGTLGYGLSISVSDFNNDGWPDIYICNDFRENDYLYLNNQNGTFRQVVEQAMPHTSRFSMGSDAADVNNDLLPDLITLDMLPDVEAIRKQSAAEDSYEIFQHKLSYGFHYQFSRNALQLNRGVKTGIPLFSDIAAFTNIEATDWSWGALLADLDNDGLKDLYITNGILRRPNDLDYISYIAATPTATMSDLELVKKMPEGSAVNRMYRNINGYSFQNVTGAWINAMPNCAQGAAYADLDLDGDLDLVVNMQNQPAHIYRNNTPADSARYLRIRLTDDDKNTAGIGARVVVHYSNKKVMHEVYTSRGWLSAVEPVAHIGMGTAQQADSVIITWPDGAVQKLYQVSSNQFLTVKKSTTTVKNVVSTQPTLSLFEEVSVPGLTFTHKENSFSALTVEPLLPWGYSAEGPPLAVADVNNDGMDDIFVGGAAGQAGALYLQQANGSFRQIIPADFLTDVGAEDVAAVFADFNNDGLVDLVVVGGGHEFAENDPRLAPRMYLNKGNGLFSKNPEAFSNIFTDAAVVRVVDYDRDNHTDLFIGGRVVAAQYGKVPKSYLLRNNGNGTFTDITVQVFATPTLGRICDAQWTDLNMDNRPDLIAAGHWMPISVWIQQPDGSMKDETQTFGLAHTTGWWNALHQIDINQDGHPHFVAGNLGLNTRLRGTPQMPLKMYIHDFDGNGTAEQILVYNTHAGPSLFHPRDQLIKQIPSLKRKYLFYSEYSTASPEDVFSKEQLSQAVQLKAGTLSHVLLKNNKNTFELIPLPAEAQFFPVFSFAYFQRANEQGIGLLAVGNQTDVQPELGYLDAGYGTTLWVNPDYSISVVPMAQSGFIVRGQGRSIAALHLKKENKKLFIVARNNQSLLAFKQNEK